MEPGEIYVVIPAFNEAGAIAAVLDPLIREGFRVVVVDDGSMDSTAEISARSGAAVVHHALNCGQGAALQTGITFALRHGARYICTYDADGQHSPGDIRALASGLEAASADVALGSRFLGRAERITRWRRWLLKAAIVFTRAHSGLQLTDTHNGLRLLTGRAARRIHLLQPRMAHASEILVQIARLGLRYVEVPVTITYSAYSTRKGQSAFGSIRILFDLLIARALK